MIQAISSKLAIFIRFKPFSLCGIRIPTSWSKKTRNTANIDLLGRVFFENVVFFRFKRLSLLEWIVYITFVRKCQESKENGQIEGVAVSYEVQFFRKQGKKARKRIKIPCLLGLVRNFKSM